MKKERKCKGCSGSGMHISGRRWGHSRPMDSRICSLCDGTGEDLALKIELQELRRRIEENAEELDEESKKILYDNLDNLYIDG